MQFDREIQNAAQAFRYIENFLNLEKIKPQKNEYRLNRMERLNEILGDPWKGPKIIHLAGSKGKGSCAHMFEAVYRQAGYKTGLYTSPHIISYSERIKIDCKPANDYQICEAMPEIQRAAEIMYDEDDPPSFFELLTTIAFIVFRNAKCDIIILETGLGGRLDATNIVRPTASIILPVEKEHTEYLGNTIKQIAGEKAGIIKKNIPVFVADQQKDARTVIQSKATELNARLYDCSSTVKSAVFTESGIQGTVKFNDTSETLALDVGIPAEIQLQNAGLVYRTVGILSPEILENTIKKALKKIQIKGRMDIVSDNPFCVFDGSHTPKSVDFALKGFTGLIKKRINEGRLSKDAPKVLLFACAEDKDYKKMLSRIADSFDTIVISQPSSFKPSKPRLVYDYCCQGFPEKQVTLEINQQEALELCMKTAGNDGAVLACGSFFLLSELYSALNYQEK